jgi:hypothetical protein
MRNRAREQRSPQTGITCDCIIRTQLKKKTGRQAKEQSHERSFLSWCSWIVTGQDLKMKADTARMMREEGGAPT